MKLACLRCKRKKIKCDKGDPICHQCVTAKSECQYVERRQRPRLAQQRVAVTSLSRRLELLEKQISSTGNRLEPALERSSSVSISSTASTPDLMGPGTANINAESSPSAVFQAPENAQDSWIYRMANDTKRCFQSQTTPISSPIAQIDTVMSALNDALEDLGKLKLRADLTESRVSLSIAPEEALQCIEAFIEMMNTLVVPDIFATALDVDLLKTLPSIIGSPYVNVDPGVHVMYFAALHYGLHQIRGPGHILAQAAYLKALEHVPAWLDSQTETEMDGYTAAMTSWVAINNLDYQLSWKFHCKSCHYLKSRGIDNLDTTLARTMEEEEKRESTRYLYWHVLSTDCLFRLFYGKPSVLRWTPKSVKPPSVMTTRNLHLTATQVMLACVWTSYTARVIETITYIDSTEHQGSGVSQRVDECCCRLEALVVEWRMEAILADPASSFPLRCLIADHVMNIYAFIIGLKRLANRLDKIDTVDLMTVRAARKVVSTLLEFEITDVVGDGVNLDPTKFIFVHFILFYLFAPSSLFTSTSWSASTPTTARRMCVNSSTSAMLWNTQAQPSGQI
ncbi:hypothetical protein M3J09_006996 [Ascochyta lentis]